MKNKSYMTISEFAFLTGIKRTNLIFYDKIGLLSPEYRGENDYRYYSRRQLGSAYLISALRDLSIGLEEIKQYANGRTPQRMISLFEIQELVIQKERKKLNRMQDMMKLYRDMAQEALSVNIDTITIRNQAMEPLFCSLPIAPEENYDISSMKFYEYAITHIELGFPLGAVTNVLNMPKDQIGTLTHLYFRVLHEPNAYKPAGRYAVAYGRCGYGQSQEVYERLFHYIEEKGLRICGSAYEEYLLNEISTPNDDDYLVRIEILLK